MKKKHKHTLYEIQVLAFVAAAADAVADRLMSDY